MPGRGGRHIWKPGGRIFDRPPPSEPGPFDAPFEVLLNPSDDMVLDAVPEFPPDPEPDADPAPKRKRAKKVREPKRIVEYRDIDLIQFKSIINLSMSEKTFQTHVIEVAQAWGWLVYHVYDARASVAGFPDLVLVRGAEVIFAELKREKNTLSGPQETWRDALVPAAMASPFMDYYLWRPSDWDFIVQRLAPPGWEMQV